MRAFFPGNIAHRQHCLKRDEHSENLRLQGPSSMSQRTILKISIQKCLIKGTYVLCIKSYFYERAFQGSLFKKIPIKSPTLVPKKIWNYWISLLYNMYVTFPRLWFWSWRYIWDAWWCTRSLLTPWSVHWYYSLAFL